METLKRRRSYFCCSIKGRFPQLVITLIGGIVAAYLALGGWAAPPPVAPQAASEVDAQTIHYPSGDVNIEAYMAKPKGAGKHPAVIVVHDNQGLSQGTKDLARLFAQSGFVAIAPDLMSHPGSATTSMSDQGYGATPAGGLPVSQTVNDVEAAFAFLKKDTSVDPAKISAVGIGWGGWRAFNLAEDEPSLYRLVVFYGVTPDDGHVSEIKSPVLAHYAQADFLVTASSLKTKQWLGNKFTYYIYPNTERGFFGGGGGAGLDLVALGGEADIEAAAREKAKSADKASSGAAAANKLAWDRTVDFLRK